MATKIDVYQMITNNIIDLLDKVDRDAFQFPFACLAGCKPAQNIDSKKLYQGINFLILGLCQSINGFNSNEWGTFKQWQAIGANVRKGEKGTAIIKYKQVKKKDTEDEYYHMIRYFTVFNADQVDGYSPAMVSDTDSLGRVDTIEAIDQFVLKTGARVRTKERDQAYFAPVSDVINMPAIDLFYDTKQPATENYYAVLFHELVHWTGSKKRLNRDELCLDKNDKEYKSKYASEEICAEIGAAFLCNQFGLDAHTLDDHVVYIDSYLKVLKNDKKAIFKIASRAQKAVNFLNDLQEQANGVEAA